MNTAQTLIISFCILLSLASLILAIFNFSAVMSKEPPKEINPEEELTKATKTISEYCVTRSHKNPCRFNQSGKKNECDCILLKKPPEGWSDANNKN